MELILKAAGREIPCFDWATALVGLRTIAGASSVTRKGVPEGTVCQVLRMHDDPYRGEPRWWVGIRQARPGETIHYISIPQIAAVYMDRLVAGEDV